MAPPATDLRYSKKGRLYLSARRKKNRKRKKRVPSSTLKQNLTKADVRNKEMENFVEITMCRLCLSNIPRENCDIIDQHARDILGVLLPKWNLDEGKHLICNDCSAKLNAAFDFKGTCVNTENRIFPYVNSENVGLLDLREIYLKENDSKPQIRENQYVCRLCMQLIFGEFKRLEQLDVNMLNTYIPEINFSSTKNPVMCEACYEAFKSHSGFLTILLENEIETKYVNDGILIPSLTTNLTTEEVDIKTEKVEIKTEEVDLKPEEICLKLEENDQSDLEEAAYETMEECNFEINNKQNQQLLMHRDPVEILMYECDECSYKTRDKWNLRKHKLKHRDPSEIPMYNCDVCGYETRYKAYLQIHKVVHSDPSEIQMYQCDECSYTSRHKKNLLRHELVHKSLEKAPHETKEECNSEIGDEQHRQFPLQKEPSKIPMYECDECSFKTEYKTSLRSHKLAHRNACEINMYKCDKCSYKTWQKNHLHTHTLMHKEPSEIRKFKCDECSYKTKERSNLIRHKLKHRDTSATKMYKCTVCSYDTKYKFNLQTHKLAHKVPSKVQRYKTRHGGNLYTNMLAHSDPSEKLRSKKIKRVNGRTGLESEENNKRYLEQVAHENNKINCEVSEPTTEKECNLEVGTLETFQPQQLQNQIGVNARDTFNSKIEVIRCAHPVPVFNCESCSFQTAYLRWLVDQDPDELQTYK